MSIKPVSDIVLDVANAADPVQSLAVTEKLARLQSSDAPADDNFSTVLGATGASIEKKAAPADLLHRMSLMGVESARTHAPLDARSKAYKGLEQLVLQRLVENMLPKDADDMFGHGTAGDIWRSMLAEQLAKQIGKSVDLGLSKAEAARYGHSGAAAAQAGQGSRQVSSPASSLNRQF